MKNKTIDINDTEILKKIIDYAIEKGYPYVTGDCFIYKPSNNIKK